MLTFLLAELNFIDYLSVEDIGILLYVNKNIYKKLTNTVIIPLNLYNDIFWCPCNICEEIYNSPFELYCKKKNNTFMLCCPYYYKII
jgi:hypothetical protein